MQNFQNVSDSQLIFLCEKFGRQALHWRAKFIGLLPEVNRRKLYKKKGFDSIFEFAFKLAGLSQEQVRNVICLERRFEDKPTLKNLLISGEVSVNKLARVASIATPENEEELAEKVIILPKAALDTLVRDVKFSEKECTSNGSIKTLFNDKSLPGQTLNFELSQENIEKLNHLHSQGHDVNKIIATLLENRRQKIEAKKAELAQEAIKRLEAKKATFKPGEKLKTSQYVSVKVKAILREEHGTKCSIPGCCKPAVENHHSQRLALAGIHDPRYMAPMCKEHHQLAHMIDQKYVKRSSVCK